MCLVRLSTSAKGSAQRGHCGPPFPEAPFFGRFRDTSLALGFLKHRDTCLPMSISLPIATLHSLWWQMTRDGKRERHCVNTF
jgi:hypothetical protein